MKTKMILIAIASTVLALSTRASEPDKIVCTNGDTKVAIELTLTGHPMGGFNSLTGTAKLDGAPFTNELFDVTVWAFQSGVLLNMLSATDANSCTIPLSMVTFEIGSPAEITQINCKSNGREYIAPIVCSCVN